MEVSQASVDKCIALLLLRPNIWNPNLTNGDEESHSFERRFGVNDLTIYCFHAFKYIFKTFLYKNFPCPNILAIYISISLVLLFGYHVFNQQHDSKEYFKA